ncbi:MAG: hypothetical protein M1828_007237 [Chrysothrix sp. TS-e1954]|nr:MAG: hypothetical protein M1828_007237 [Chrysothrix sp. TS-e1954]
MALAGRAPGGLLNGNVGVIQTMVGELVTLPEHEPKAYAIMPFVWSIGTIIGPALGGCLAQPSMNYPSIFPPDGIFARYAFLLPNLVCAILLLIAVLAGFFAIEETHPDMQPWSTKADLDATHAETPLMATAGSTEHAPTNLQNQSYGTFNSVNVEEEEKWRVKSNGRPSSLSSASSAKTYSRRVVMTIVALGIFTYHSMTYDTLFPIYLQDERTGAGHDQSAAGALAGGLGLSTQQVGIIMAFNGIIALFVQGIIFPWLASRLGIWRLFLLVTFGHPIAYVIVPFLALIPVSALQPGIYVCLCVRNFFSILAYPVLLILIKEASPGPSSLGKINGLAASTGAGCRTIASPVAGWLYGLGIDVSFTPLAWWSSGIVAVFGAAQLFFMRRYKERTSVRTLAHYMSTETLQNPSHVQVVHINVQDTIDEESEPSEDSEYSDEEEPLL